MRRRRSKRFASLCAVAAGVAVSFVALSSAYAQDLPPDADRPRTEDSAKKKPAHQCPDADELFDLLRQASEEREANDPDVKSALDEQQKAQEDYDHTKKTAEKADAASGAAEDAAKQAKAAADAADKAAAASTQKADDAAKHPPAGGYPSGVFTQANADRAAAKQAHASADEAQSDADAAKQSKDAADKARDNAKARLDKANKRLDDAKEKAKEKNGGGQEKALDGVGDIGANPCPPPSSPLAATATFGAAVAFGEVRDPPTEAVVRVGADYRVLQTSRYAIDVTGRATLEGGNQFVNVAVAPGVRAPIKLMKDAPVAFVPAIEVGPSYLTWTGANGAPSQSSLELRVVATAGVEIAVSRALTLRAEPGVVADVGTFGNTRLALGVGAAWRFR